MGEDRRHFMGFDSDDDSRIFGKYGVCSRNRRTYFTDWFAGNGGLSSN